MFPLTQENEIKKLESLEESEVRYQIAQFKYSGSTHLAEEWLLQKEAARLAATEAETLAVAKEAVTAASLSASAANRSASAAYEQARWAKWAAAIAATMAIITARSEIYDVIKSLL